MFPRDLLEGDSVERIARRFPDGKRLSKFIFVLNKKYEEVISFTYIRTSNTHSCGKTILL